MKNARASAPRRRRAGVALTLAACLAGVGIGGGVVGSGCLPERSVPVQVRFEARVDGEPFSCDGAPRAGSERTSRLTPHDLRFYVHGVELVDRTGKAAPVALVPDGAWQSDSVALLDFENGAGSCANGTAGTHTSVLGRVRPGDYVGLRFTLGVPFELNHGDPVRAAPPLTLGRMHWGWQAGYKFLRFEGVRPDGLPVRVHLGSTGCEGSIGNVRSCSRPNQATIELAGFDRQASAVVVDVAALGRGAAGASAVDGAQSCMSDAGDPGCREPFATLGLGPSTGAESGRQRLFSVRGS